MKKVLLIVLSLATLGVSAQSNLFGISWETNIPTNNNYITKTSFTGGKLEYRHFMTDVFSIGVAVNWATYEQYFPKQTFQVQNGNSAVTGDFVAQTYQVPITATAHYYFKGGKMFKPYAGIALGGQSLQQDLYYNVYVSDDNNWGFVARPELGVVIKPNQFGSWGFLLSAGYSYATNKTELVGNNHFSNFGIGLGVVFGQ